MLDRKETVEVLPPGSQRHLRTRRKAETNRTLMWPSAESASLWGCGEQDVSLAARQNKANSRRDYSHCRPRAERACSPRRTASRALCPTPGRQALSPPFGAGYCRRPPCRNQRGEKGRLGFWRRYTRRNLIRNGVGPRDGTVQGKRYCRRRNSWGKRHGSNLVVRSIYTGAGRTRLY